MRKARFAAQQHYAGDLFAGAAMGWFIGTYVYHTHEEHQGHVHRAVNRITPEIRPSTHTYAVSFNLGH